jgi:hypothetical protein
VQGWCRYATHCVGKGEPDAQTPRPTERASEERGEGKRERENMRERTLLRGVVRCHS